MRRGAASGVLFCAEVEFTEGRRTFLRFVPAEAGWQPANNPGGILRETGTCLRLIDCNEDTPLHMPSNLADRVFDFWTSALTDILQKPVVPSISLPLDVPRQPGITLDRHTWRTLRAGSFVSTISVGRGGEEERYWQAI